MAIRNAVKGILLVGSHILLNRCTDRKGGEYFALPGGGQQQYETMAEALTREFLEETGYAVTPVRFLALYEEIIDNSRFRQKAPDYSHKIYHVFLCALAHADATKPTEPDAGQTGTLWVSASGIQDLPLFPAVVRENIPALLDAGAAIFLGSDHR